MSFYKNKNRALSSRNRQVYRGEFCGHIRAAYGCSLGGSFVGLLAARQNIHMDYGSWLILVIDSK